VAFGVGVGIGMSIGARVSNSSLYGKGVPGAGEGSSGGEAASCSISSDCSGVVVVAWIGIGFKGSLYEVWVEILEDVISLQEGPVDGESSVC